MGVRPDPESGSPTLPGQSDAMRVCERMFGRANLFGARGTTYLDWVDEFNQYAGTDHELVTRRIAIAIEEMEERQQ